MLGAPLTLLAYLVAVPAASLLQEYGVLRSLAFLGADGMGTRPDARELARANASWAGWIGLPVLLFIGRLFSIPVPYFGFGRPALHLEPASPFERRQWVLGHLAAELFLLVPALLLLLPYKYLLRPYAPEEVTLFVAVIIHYFFFLAVANLIPVPPLLLGRALAPFFGIRRSLIVPALQAALAAYVVADAVFGWGTVGWILVLSADLLFGQGLLLT